MITETSLPWNLLTKNLHGHELLREKIRQKISKLEKYLAHFPPDSIHLQINLERHLKKDLFFAALTLRLPSNILHSQKSASDVITAFDSAVKALLRELESLKSALRREASWKRKPRRELLQEAKTARFTPEPMPEGAGPQKPEDLLRDLFQQHYPRLLRHARRLVRHDELYGEIPKNALDAREIVDETIRHAIAQRPRKPPEMIWLVWFYRLIHEELRRERSALKLQSQEQVSLEKPPERPAGVLVVHGYETELPDGALEPSAERARAESAGVIADARTQSPDEAAARKDLLEELQHAIQGWPRLEREVFELYFVEGFEPDEIGMIVGQTLKKMEETIGALQEHLREEVLKQALS